MAVHRAYKFRLYPTPEQAARLSEYAGATRFVYNLALEQRRDWWRQFRSNTGRSLSWAAQSVEVTQLRREHDWLAAVPRSAFEHALRELDRAFSNFFRGGGFPKFRAKDRHSSFCLQFVAMKVRQLNGKWSATSLKGCRDLKFRQTRAITGDIKTLTITGRAGKWFIVFGVEQPDAAIALPSGAIGIDRGIANCLAMSTGELREMPASVKALNNARRGAQRVLSRRKKGSKRQAAQRAVVARMHLRSAAGRQHWLHEQSTDIANRFGTVAVEALPTARMTKAGSGAAKRGLNRSILEQGWAMFADMLSYKLAARGGTLHFVNPAYTSQTCSACGSVAKESRKSQASFKCVDCGHVAHADINAAINILRASRAGVEGSGCGPVEAQTGEVRRHLENLAA